MRAATGGGHEAFVEGQIGVADWDEFRGLPRPVGAARLAEGDKDVAFLRIILLVVDDVVVILGGLGVRRQWHVDHPVDDRIVHQIVGGLQIRLLEGDWWLARADTGVDLFVGVEGGQTLHEVIAVEVEGGGVVFLLERGGDGGRDFGEIDKGEELSGDGFEICR